jgi:hypothetical protein
MENLTDETLFSFLFSKPHCTNYKEKKKELPATLNI